jgi:NAD(P) transhydrogenase subunit beta
MTALPQLVAGFTASSGWPLFLSQALRLTRLMLMALVPLVIESLQPAEMGLGSAIGAITFTGSLIAFGKLQGLISGKPLSFAGQHLLNAALGAAIVFLLVIFMMTESHFIFWMLTLVALSLGFLLILPIGGADMPVVISC